MHFILIHFKLSIKSANFLEPYLLWEANNNKRVFKSLLRLHFHSQLRKWISGKLAFSNNYSYASVSSSCTQPPPLPGNCWAFALLVSPGCRAKLIWGTRQFSQPVGTPWAFDINVVSIKKGRISKVKNFYGLGLEKLGDVFKVFLILMCMLWFILGLMLVSISFAIVPDYGNEYVTKEHKLKQFTKIFHQN